MAQHSLDRQEYDDLRHWLAGKKSSAQGRIWRRQMQIQVQKTLPRSVRSVMFSLATIYVLVLFRMLLPLWIFNLLPFVVEGLLSYLALAGTPLPYTVVLEQVRSIVLALVFIVNIVLLVSTILAALIWVITDD